MLFFIFVYPGAAVAPRPPPAQAMIKPKKMIHCQICMYDPEEPDALEPEEPDEPSGKEEPLTLDLASREPEKNVNDL